MNGTSKKPTTCRCRNTGRSTTTKVGSVRYATAPPEYEDASRSITATNEGLLGGYCAQRAIGMCWGIFGMTLLLLDGLYGIFAGHRPSK